MVLAYSWRSRLKSPEEIKTFKSLIEVAKQRYNTNDQMLNELVSESVWRTYNGPYSITSNSVSKLSADESQRLHLLMANFWFVAGYNKGSVFAKDIINYVSKNHKSSFDDFVRKLNLIQTDAKLGHGPLLGQRFIDDIVLLSKSQKLDEQEVRDVNVKNNDYKKRIEDLDKKARDILNSTVYKTPDLSMRAPADTVYIIAERDKLPELKPRSVTNHKPDAEDARTLKDMEQELKDFVNLYSGPEVAPDNEAEVISNNQHEFISNDEAGTISNNLVQKNNEVTRNHVERNLKFNSRKSVKLNNSINKNEIEQVLRMVKPAELSFNFNDLRRSKILAQKPDTTENLDGWVVPMSEVKQSLPKLNSNEVVFNHVDNVIFNDNVFNSNIKGSFVDYMFVVNTSKNYLPYHLLSKLPELILTGDYFIGKNAEGISLVGTNNEKFKLPQDPAYLIGLWTYLNRQGIDPVNISLLYLSADIKLENNSKYDSILKIFESVLNHDVELVSPSNGQELHVIDGNGDYLIADILSTNLNTFEQLYRLFEISGAIENNDLMSVDQRIAYRQFLGKLRESSYFLSNK